MKHHFRKRVDFRQRRFLACGVLILTMAAVTNASELPRELISLLKANCTRCHNNKEAKGGLNLVQLSFDLQKPEVRSRWIQIYDRVDQREMPPKADSLSRPERDQLTSLLRSPLVTAERAEILVTGRGPMRRLNRDEFEQNLRDLLQLPHLDIRDMLPADRTVHHFDKVSTALDMSRVQLVAYLDAAEAALRSAMVTTEKPPPVHQRRVAGRPLSRHESIAGGRQSLFFVRDSKGTDLAKGSPPGKVPAQPDPTVEMALFRSPGWPYSVFPRGILATADGEYRVRFAARAVVQLDDYVVQSARKPVPMRFRARRPSNHDIAEDIRPTGDLIDIQPQGGIYETTVYLQSGQTIEYGLLGLPNPQIDAQGRTGYYRYPPLPAGGQPGVAFRWLEMEGPLESSEWPPASHQILFDDLGSPVTSTNLEGDARRLMQRFIHRAAREPVPADALAGFEKLAISGLQRGLPFAEALLAGYQAFLCSDLFLYLQEPAGTDAGFAIANRLSHFLGDTRPDDELTRLASAGQLRDPQILRPQLDRLIASPGFTRFVEHFLGCWLDLRELRRDSPDIRLYPEYRLDDYLVGSMAQETHAFFTEMVRANLPATTLIDADFLFANDRLAEHYGLPPLTGSKMRRVALPATSPYGGLLTQAALLKISANGSSTSPVLRGAWMMDRLLGNPPPAPPPGVPAVEPDIRGATTMREQLALHTQSKVCASCHASFDPIGLALENFDVLGAWRTRYRGLGKGDPVTGIDRTGHDFRYVISHPVDASGTLTEGSRFRDIHGLKTILTRQPRQLAKNLLQQFTVYATGTPIRFSDRTEIANILDSCRDQGYRVGDLLYALIESPIFLGYPVNEP